MRLPPSWEIFLTPYFDLISFYKTLDLFISDLNNVIPDKNSIFKVFDYVQPEEVQCVLYGEDPYPRLSSACGIAFWDKEINSWDDKTNGNSLKNILKAILVAQGKAYYTTPISRCREIAKDENFLSPPDLFVHWLDQGVLLINTALTFSGKDDKKSHLEFWRDFHQALIKALNQRNKSPYYILWGNKAQRSEQEIYATIDNPSKVIKQGHPTFIHQFMDKNDQNFSPFSEIINKTGIAWI